LLNHQLFSADCSILLRFVTDFDHLIANVPRSSRSDGKGQGRENVV